MARVSTVAYPSAVAVFSATNVSNVPDGSAVVGAPNVVGFPAVVSSLLLLAFPQLLVHLQDYQLTDELMYCYLTEQSQNF